MINFPIEKIVSDCEKIGVNLSNKTVDDLNIYANLLVEWNEKMNLTAITEPEEVVWKHFFDCILFFKNVNVPTGAKIIDVGTGAGFPGMVLKIVRNDIDLTLLDGLNKRLIFLDEVLKTLKLSAKVVHLRAEEGAKKEEYREKYDFATSRAVANMNTLSEYCLPYVKVGGSFVALKGPAGNEELENAKNAIEILGGGNSAVYKEQHEMLGERSIITVEKIAQTKPKYPRASGKISKSPLK
ncbi:MAG: 16S rRNA (guanine(527)-N(7))-methyltransferase RsmG [Ruminococcaceae bacterium]|nr:16S rRNA (guanine(527)-N(7))-methyltransferase RsmG [Oscillospiraceae bacterium]